MRESLDRWVREHPFMIDSVLVFALLVFPGIATLTIDLRTWYERLLVTGLLTVPLAWRRTSPALSAGTIYATAFLHIITGFGMLPSDLTVFIALYSVAAYGSRRTSWCGLGFALLGNVITLWTMFLGAMTVNLVEVAVAGMIGGGFVLAVWVAGNLRGTRRAYLDAVVDRARRLEIEREQQAELAAAAERARIARELHDVVAHSLSVIIAQADGGRYAARTSPGAAVEALDVVATTGRTALTDMRRLLGVLRDGEGPQHGPQPDFDTIGDLVASVRASGLQVTYASAGHPRPVGAAMGLAAYRIVQEALTNVLKHAGPVARAVVQIRWEADVVRITVDDDGRGASAASDGRGQGVSGMRERARLYGGRVEAAPKPGGGYRVQVLLPCPGSAAPSVVRMVAPIAAPHPAPPVGQAPRRWPAPMSAPASSPAPAPPPASVEAGRAGRTDQASPNAEAYADTDEIDHGTG